MSNVLEYETIFVCTNQKQNIAEKLDQTVQVGGWQPAVEVRVQGLEISDLFLTEALCPHNNNSWSFHTKKKDLLLLLQSLRTIIKF
jgi:hypothetical protein